jgi:hypothetical protein
MEQKIVVNMRGGAVHKGVTHDFSPKQDSFHVLPAEGGGVPVRVQMQDMKAMFWVRDYLGNREFVARREFNPERAAEGRRAIVTFADGETMWGTVIEDDPALPIFFVPSDERDNNLKVFVIRSR